MGACGAWEEAVTRRLLITGGRDYRDAATVNRALDRVLAERGIAVLIHGAARGADTLAAEWAASRGVPVEAYPARWETDGRKAGPLRNQRMLDEGKPTACVAFPGGTGTADMVRRCEAAGVPVWRVGWGT